MAKKQRLSDEARAVDLLERFGAAMLYCTTEMGQTDVARVLGIDNNRANKILKGIRKDK